ncbi:MAG: hypothetical protein AAF950_12390 [Pseudomonadota bacterium]
MPYRLIAARELIKDARDFIGDEVEEELGQAIALLDKAYQTATKDVGTDYLNEERTDLVRAIRRFGLALDPADNRYRTDKYGT